MNIIINTNMPLIPLTNNILQLCWSSLERDLRNYSKCHRKMFPLCIVDIRFQRENDRDSWYNGQGHNEEIDRTGQPHSVSLLYQMLDFQSQKLNSDRCSYRYNVQSSAVVQRQESIKQTSKSYKHL